MKTLELIKKMKFKKAENVFAVVQVDISVIKVQTKDGLLIIDNKYGIPPGVYDIDKFKAFLKTKDFTGIEVFNIENPSFYGGIKDDCFVNENFNQIEITKEILGLKEYCVNNN
jgi:hypothetical protein